MKIWVLVAFALTVHVQLVHSQSRPVPFSEAHKALNRSESEVGKKDSLRLLYKGKWILAGTLGNRFIGTYNQASEPDTVTFADFTSRRLFFGFSGGYFLKENWLLTANLDVTVLEREQEVTSISFGGANGITAEGTGNGGVLLNLHTGASYYFKRWNYIGLYTSAEIGAARLVAKGGEGSFSLFGGQSQEVREEIATVFSGRMSLGFSYRPNPILMIDIKSGYQYTAETGPIGGITSPGGLITAFSLQFVLNPNSGNN